MNMHVSFGVDRDMSIEPHALCLFLKEPVTLLGKERDDYYFQKVIDLLFFQLFLIDEQEIDELLKKYYTF